MQKAKMPLILTLTFLCSVTTKVEDAQRKYFPAKYILIKKFVLLFFCKTLSIELLRKNEFYFPFILFTTIFLI